MLDIAVPGWPFSRGGDNAPGDVVHWVPVVAVLLLMGRISAMTAGRRKLGSGLGGLRCDQRIGQRPQRRCQCSSRRQPAPPLANAGSALEVGSHRQA